MMARQHIWKAVAIAASFAAIAAFGSTANNYILHAGTMLAMSIVLALAWNHVASGLLVPRGA